MLIPMKYMLAMLNRKLRVKLMQTYTAGPVPPASNWVMKSLSNKTRLTNSTLFQPKPLFKGRQQDSIGNSLVVESNREPVLQKQKLDPASSPYQLTIQESTAGLLDRGECPDLQENAGAASDTSMNLRP